MFYLTKRIDEKQCTVGDLCMVLSDFSGVPAGTLGKVEEIYEEGVMIQWPPNPNDKWERKPLADGFARDELEYLAFATEKHPKVDPTVFNIGGAKVPGQRLPR